MKNSNNEEIEEKKKEANILIHKAEEFIDNGKIKAGFKMYQKVTNIYFDLGSYMKIPDVFFRISTLLKQETMIYEALEYLRKIRFRLKKRDLTEIEAKIMMVIGNLSFELKDYSSAAESYEEAADLFLKADPEDYRLPSSMFLIRAAECLEYLGKQKTGEKILVKAVLQLDIDAMDYLSEEFNGLNIMEQGKNKEAIQIYQKLLQIFKDALEKHFSSIVDENSGLKNIGIFAKTRLMHIISEYRLILMYLYDQVGEKTKSQDIAYESIDQLNSGILMIKEMIQKDIWNRQDLKRLLYMGFMRAYFQKYHHIKNKTPEQQIQFFITKDLNGKVIDIIKKLPYYDLCVKTETYNISDLNELLNRFNLGRLEKYKKIFLS